MNKRIKRKHIAKENKNMMDSTLKYLKHLGLTPFNIEYPNGYFVFENKNSYEMMHFQLKENPQFLFGVWYKEFNLKNPDRVVKLPLIFGERLSVLDKFKPSRAEWSPLYNNYLDKDLEFELSDYWSTLRLLPNFVKTPWNYIPGETEDSFKELSEYVELNSKYTDEVLQEVYKKVEVKFKELGIPLGILVSDPFWYHKNLYLIFEDGMPSDRIYKLFDDLYNFVQFELTDIVEELSRQEPYTEYVSIYSSAFNWHLDYFWLSDKDVLEKAKTMSFMELNEQFKKMDLKGSDFIRFIGG